jgi:hypothetical protein
MAVSQIQSSIDWKKARRRAPEPSVAAQRSANFVVEMDFESIAALRLSCSLAVRKI